MDFSILPDDDAFTAQQDTRQRQINQKAGLQQRVALSSINPNEAQPSKQAARKQRGSRRKEAPRLRTSSKTQSSFTGGFDTEREYRHKDTFVRDPAKEMLQKERARLAKLAKLQQMHSYEYKEMDEEYFAKKSVAAKKRREKLRKMEASECDLMLALDDGIDSTLDYLTMF